MVNLRKEWCEDQVNVSMALKVKYGLVHVPSQRKCRSWVREVTVHRAAGLPPEQAGQQAAHRVFPYEARELHLPDAVPVPELLTLAQKEGL